MRRLQGKNIHTGKLMKDLCGGLRSGCLHIYETQTRGNRPKRKEQAHAQLHQRGTQGTNVLTVRGQTAIRGSRHGLSKWPCAGWGILSYFTIWNATVQSITQLGVTKHEHFEGKSKQPNSLKTSLSGSQKPTREASPVSLSVNRVILTFEEWL